jgi:drug/metabolite transporter (DMT)-like permease
VTERRAGSIAAAGAGILFGTSNVATVYVLLSFTPIGGALLRSILAAGLVAIMWLAAILLGRRGGRFEVTDGAVAATPPWQARGVRLLVIGLCGGPAFLVGLNLAVAGTGPTVTAFVSGLYAVFAAALAPFVLSEPLRPRVIVGLICALVGCALLSGLRPDPAFTQGFIAAFVAAVVYGFYLVLGRRWSVPYQLGPLPLTASTIGTTIAVLVPWIVLVDRTALDVDGPVPEALAGLVVMGIALAVGQSLVMASARRIQAARTAAFLLLNPVSALVLSAILLGERLDPMQILGAGLVLAGIAIAIGLDRLVWTSRPAVSPGSGA